MNTTRILSSFGRRQGRALHPNAKRLMQELLPTIEIALPREGLIEPHILFASSSSPCLRGEVRRGESTDERLPPPENATESEIRAFTPSPAGRGGKENRVVRLEIGFGSGEHLAAQARANPNVGFIGCEPFINGVVKLLAVIETESLQNIRLFTDDARRLCAALAPESIAHIDILFPDPWPKSRHHKRRLLSHKTLAMLHRIQPAGGTLQLATDHRDYSAWMLEHLRDSKHYEWLAECAADFEQPPASWVQTRYQRKTSEQGREPVFLLAKRR